MRSNPIRPALLLATFIFVVNLGFQSLATAAPAVDNSLYAELLQKYVADGKVDYAGFKSEETKLDRYLKILETVNPETLSRDAQFAYYINLYNAWTIKLILSAYPGIKSIKDLGSLFQSPWKKKIVRVDGDVITLDQVEHEILRPRFKDPRVHFAINCASRSCPPLRSEPYREDTLDRQLEDATRSFINNPKNFKLDGDELYVSRIFDWFSKDFQDDPLGFYLKYATGDLKKKLQAESDRIKVRYLDYDWSLNDR